MELLIISDSKIKISLSKNDLDSYKISCDSIDYDTTETRRVVWSLLDDVKKQSGFDAAKSRIFVQIYPSRDGGCELYVSKLGKQLPSAFDKAVSPPLLPSVGCKKECYIFDGVNGLIAVCKELYTKGYNGRSDAYSDDIGQYFLCAEGEGFDFMSEFGVRRSYDIAELYIKEHCREICTQNAVSTLGVL